MRLLLASSGVIQFITVLPVGYYIYFLHILVLTGLLVLISVLPVRYYIYLYIYKYLLGYWC